MKKSANSKVAMLAVAFFMAIGIPVLTFGQGKPHAAPPQDVQVTGVVDDWSSSHLVFSNPGTQEDAAKKGKQARWQLVTKNPRYLMQNKKRLGPDVAASGNSTNLAIWSQANLSASASKKQPPPRSPVTRDWSLSLGSGTVAANMSPAKYSFDAGNGTLTGSGGASPSGNCLNDFVVYGLNVAGTASHANLVGIDDLYAGSSPTGLCGTTPNVKFAYNTTTASGGKIATSPLLSLDGSMVAFVETTASSSILHVLRWKDTDGTVAAPSASLITNATSATSCTAPCMTTLTFDASHTSSISSPYMDYSTDTLYVGNDNGSLFQITGVFTGTPAVNTTSPWSAAGLTVAAAVKLTSPIVDFGTGNIFVGGSNGRLYAITAAGTVSSIAVGSGDPQGGGVSDPPIVDGSNGMVFAYSAANAAGVGAATLSTKAVVVQADTTTPLGSVQVATLGEGSLGSATNVAMVAGTFDNTYFNYGGTGVNDGFYYAVGTAAAATSPTLYQVPFSGIGSITLNTPGAGYSSPGVSISGDGSGATATPSGSVDTVTVTTPGSGYTTIPTVGFTAAPTGGTTATGTASVGLSAIAVTANGAGFTSVPTVTITGSGAGGGVATAALGVNSVTVTTPGSYLTGTGFPTVGFPGGTTNATGTAREGLLSIGVTAGGSFTSLPTISIGGTGSGGVAAPHMGVTAVTINSGGSGYSAPPTINFAGSGGAAATAVMGVNSVSITAGGTYTTFPTGVTFSGSATGSPLVGLNAIGVSAGGSFTTLPSITIGGTGSGGSAAPVLGVTSVAVTAGGTGYTTPPTVAYTGTGSGGSATAALGVLSVTIGASGTSGCTSTTTVSFSGGGGSGAAGTVNFSFGRVTSVTMTNHGTGYTSVPTVTFVKGNCSATPTGTAVLEVVSVAAGTAGNYTTFPGVSFSGGSGSGAAASATATIESVNIGAAGSYSTYPTATTTGGATLSVSSVKIVGVTVTSAGSGYLSPPTVTFNPAGATGTADLKLVSVTVTTAGSATTYPTATVATGNATFTSTTTTIASVSITTAGSYSTFPTATTTGGATLTVTASVVSVVVATPGTGYTAGPINLTFSTGTAAATADLEVETVAVTTAGVYTTFPVASITGGTTNPTLTTTAKIVDVTLGTGGSGYATNPAVTFTGSHGGAASTTISVTAVNLTYGGGGYSSASVNFTGSSTTAAAATANINDGTVMTAGTPTGLRAVTGTINIQTSPITEIFTNANTDLLFYGDSAGNVFAQDVTGGLISGPTTLTETGGTSGIVIDNISSTAQASSIYFATLSGSGIVVNVASASRTSGTVTITTQIAHGFASGNSVTIAGVTCSTGSTQVNTTGTITVTGTTSFTFTSGTGSSTCTNNTGTATDNSITVSNAVKLTQVGLN